MDPIDICTHITEAIQEAREDLQKKLDETYGKEKPCWPVVVAWLALVAWMLPVVGVPVGILTIVGGHKTRRPLVLTVGIISLMLACFNSGAGFIMGA